jgi:hypothetical protein
MTARIVAVLGAVLLVSASVPFAEEAEPMEMMDFTPAACIDTAFDESVDAKPKPGLPGGCLPSQPLTCASMPIPVGGSCSCSSTLLDQRCKSCDGTFKGRVLRTTCTVYSPCWNPPCDLQMNFSRTGLSCTP